MFKKFALVVLLAVAAASTTVMADQPIPPCNDPDCTKTPLMDVR